MNYFLKASKHRTKGVAENFFFRGATGFGVQVSIVGMETIEDDKTKILKVQMFYYNFLKVSFTSFIASHC